MERIRAVLDNPGKSLRFGILFGVIGIGLLMAGLFGTGRLFYCRYVAVPIFIISYFFIRSYFRSRMQQRNQSSQQGEQQPAQPMQMTDTQLQHPPAVDTQYQQPYPPTGGTQYGFSDMQNQTNQFNATASGRVSNDASLPPPYPTFSWPGQHNTPALPPPPSYDDVVKGSK